MFFFFLLKCQEETAVLKMDGKWETSDEISHLCFLYMMQNPDGNKPDFLFFFVLTRA